MKRINPESKYSKGMTMTVAELIEALQKYDPDLPAVATWESVGAGIRAENFSVVKHEGHDQLVIDVEDYG